MDFRPQSGPTVLFKMDRNGLVPLRSEGLFVKMGAGGGGGGGGHHTLITHEG